MLRVIATIFHFSADFLNIITFADSFADSFIVGGSNGVFYTVGNNDDDGQVVE